MQLYITTLGRLNIQLTLSNLPSAIRQETILVVQDHEYKIHEEKWGRLVREVRALPATIRTLGPTRAAVYSWAEDKKIVLLDDDLHFYVRKAVDDWHLLYATDNQLVDMFDEIESKLDAYAHVGVSGREGNNRVLEYGVENTRYMRLLAYRTGIKCAEHGRIDGMSDFDVNLQLLKNGYPSYVFYHYAQGQSGTQTPGGCSLDRTLAKHSAEVDFMVEAHMPFVKKRLKENKTGGEFGRRPEVTVYWKKAFESSQA